MVLKRKKIIRIKSDPINLGSFFMIKSSFSKNESVQEVHKSYEVKKDGVKKRNAIKESEVGCGRPEPLSRTGSFKKIKF